MARFGRIPGLIEESSQLYYDTLTITVGTATYRYFVTPVSGTKSRLKTNMVQSGQLPPPQSMLVKAVRVVVKTATSALVDEFLNKTYIVFKVGEKEALVGPTMLFNAGAGSYNHITTDVGQNGVPDARSIWALDKPIQIGVGQNFYLDIIYDTAPASGHGAFDVLVVLDGVLVRGVQ
jgi:hypothetical protein